MKMEKMPGSSKYAIYLTPPHSVYDILILMAKKYKLVWCGLTHSWYLSARPDYPNAFVMHVPQSLIDDMLRRFSHLLVKHFIHIEFKHKVIDAKQGVIEIG